MGGKSRKTAGEGGSAFDRGNQPLAPYPQQPAPAKTAAIDWSVQPPPQQMPQPQYGPLTQGQGWDMTQPGMAEQYANMAQMGWMQQGHAGDYWGANQGAFGSPGVAEQYFGQHQNALNQTSQSQQALDALKGEADFGTYYDRAKERTAGDVNSALAARGMFGSSAGMDQLNQATTDLDAQRANREADYNLARSGLQGQLAGQADSQRMAALGLGGQLAGMSQSAEMGRLGQGMGMAQGLDAMNDARRMQGMQAFSMADNLRRMRGRDYMSDMMGMAGATSGQIGQANQQQLGMDMALMDQMIQAALGYPREALNQDYLNQQTHRSDYDTMMSSMGTFMGGQMGGK